MSADDITPGEDQELYHRGLRFLKQARALRGLSPAAFQRIERRLDHPARAQARRVLGLAAATVVVVLLTGAGLAIAHVDLRRLPIVGRLFGERVVAPSPAQPASRLPSRPSPVKNTIGAAPAPMPVSTVSDARVLVEPDTSTAPLAAVPIGQSGSTGGRRIVPPSSRRLAIRSPESVRPVDLPVPLDSAENPILAESTSFATALGRWHRERDARAALAALDAHDRHFPAGRLAPESRLLRAEIALADGREPEALALLDLLPITGSPRARELYTLRGELRIKYGRCREGKADVDEVLAKGVADGLGRRAVEALHHCP